MDAQEVHERLDVIAEVKTWLGTPFGDCSDIKGPNGCVDCAMLLRRVFMDVGLVEPFDPRPYSSQWFMHHDEEIFMGIVSRFAVEVDRAPISGDVLLFKFGRCYAHGGIMVENRQIIHAYKPSGKVVTSNLTMPRLAYLNNGLARPCKVFDRWALGR